MISVGKLNAKGGKVFLVVLGTFTALGTLLGWYQAAAGGAQIAVSGVQQTGASGFWAWFWTGVIGGIVVGGVIGKVVTLATTPLEKPPA